jgi:hypothetical protein
MEAFARTRTLFRTPCSGLSLDAIVTVLRLREMRIDTLFAVVSNTSPSLLIFMMTGLTWLMRGEAEGDERQRTVVGFRRVVLKTTLDDDAKKEERGMVV